MEKFNLENRLILFADSIIEVSESLPHSPAGKYLSNQLSRSGIAPALNYGEAQSAESRKDFIHKMKICLKELRETHVCLKIIERRLYVSESKLSTLMKENHELISIFVKSIQTAKRNMQIVSKIKTV